MPTQRQLQVSRMLQGEVSHLLMRELQDELRDIIVTVTQVSVTPDLRIARIYYSVLPDSQTGAVQSVIDSRAGFLRKRLGESIRHTVKYVPSLEFYYDDSAEEAIRVNRMIDELNIPPEDEENRREE